MESRIILRVLAVAAALPAAAAVADDIDAPVRELLRQHCWDCHGSDTQESGLRLDSMASALKGGDSGEQAIVPGDSRQSYLLKLVAHEDADERMPPDGEPLAEQEIALLRAWVDREENWAAAREQLRGASLEHWSLQPVRRPELTTNRLPIDELVGRRLDAAGVAASPPADRRTLIRRLMLVMHGLPPTPGQVEAFLRDRRPDAWKLLVEQTLHSPRYGERWAAHWLDLVGFGETHGFETNRERPNAWPYRDWVIRSLNEDKPYDQFVRQQLAGDLRGAPAATGFLVAGPYDVVKGQDKLLRLTQRQDELAGMINATGTAFLGLTLGCARCHNHKFDPVTHTDYYAMQAVLAGVQHGERTMPPTDEQTRQLAEAEAAIAELQRKLEPFLLADGGVREPVSPRGNVERFEPLEARLVRLTVEETTGGQPCIDELEIFAEGRNVALAKLGAKASSGGDFTHPLHKLEHIHDGQYGNPRSWIAKQVPGWVQIELPRPMQIERIEWARDREGKYADRLPTKYRIEAAMAPGQWTLVASSADRRPYVEAGQDAAEIAYDFAGRDERIVAEGERWAAELQRQRKRLQQLKQGQKIYAGKFVQPGPTRRLHRGDPTSPREPVAPDAIAALGRLGLSDDAPEAERRLALARWITRPDNPLTARVIVNRLWQFHFGTGIVDTPSDFGANGAEPSHPLLLDYLADELVRSGWSLKHIHRLILGSRTWRQDSRPRADAMRVDAGSRLLWRFPPRRLSAEAIRDCLLAASGVLDDRMGGPGFSAFEVEMENVRHYFPKQEFGPDDWRRMIYMTKVRQEKDAVFGVFDCPDASQVVAKRSRSTTPLQALSLLNSRFVNQQAGLLAGRLRREAGEEAADQIDLAYRLCFGRPPQAAELRDAESFAAEHGLAQLARAMLNANEFVFIP